MHNFKDFNFHSNIYKAIDACGYTKPTPVQIKAIPAVLERQDVVVSAQTGTGKTAAFVLPSLHHLAVQPAMKKTRILILTPTRELASQITKAANKYGKFMRFNIVSLVGGMSYHHQIKDLGRGADIIVATPGRLLDHIEQKRVNLFNIEMFILDEADRMLDMGFIEDVQYIAKLTPTNRQTLLFSATLDNKLMNAVRYLLKNPVRIDLSNEKIAAPQIKQAMYKTKNTQHKFKLLKHFLNEGTIYKAIIFSATKINADKLANQLRDEGFAAAALHGDLRQNVRNRTLEQLRRDKIQFLVATDVAARGIDINDITHVINYDLPRSRSCEDYVHRIGRTGRAGKDGVAISFVLPTDMRHVQAIERYIGQRIQLIQNVDLDTNDIVAPKKETHAPEILTLRKSTFPHNQNNKENKYSKNDSKNKKTGKSYKIKTEKSFRDNKTEKSFRDNKTEKNFRDKTERSFRDKTDKKDNPNRKRNNKKIYANGKAKFKSNSISENIFTRKKSDNHHSTKRLSTPRD